MFAICLRRLAAAPLSPRPGEVGCGAPCAAPGGSAPPQPALTVLVPAPDWRALPRGPSCLSQGQPRRLPQSPGRNAGPWVPPSQHTRSRRPTCASAPAGAAPRGLRVSGRFPGAAPRGGPAGDRVREPRAGAGRPGVRARGRSGPPHTKAAAGRRGGAGRGRGRQEGAGAGRAAIKPPPPPRQPRSRPGADGCSCCAACAGAAARSPPDSPSRRRAALPAPTPAPRRHRLRLGPRRAPRPPPGDPERGTVSAGARGREGRGRRAPCAGDGPGAPLAAGPAPRPCGGLGGCGASGPRGADVGAEELSQPPPAAPATDRRPAPVPGPRGPGGGPGQEKASPGPAAGSPGPARLSPVHPSWCPCP